MQNSGKLNVAWLYDDSLDTDDGVAQYVKTLGAWMSEQGHNVTYLVGESRLSSWHGAPVHSLSKNLRIRWSGNRLSVPIKAKLKQIDRLLKNQKFDVMHVTMPFSPLMAGRVIKRLPPETTLVGTWHIYPANRATASGSKLLKPIYGENLKRFDEFISVSLAAQEYAKKIFGVSSTIIPNVVNLKAMSPKQAATTNRGRIVFLGRLVKRKGVKKLIEAVAYIRDQYNDQDFELIIAGDGPDRHELERLVAKLKLEQVVTFLGYIDEAKKPALLASADVACFPSLYGESFGVVLIEAMAAGAKVVVGGDNPGYRSVLGPQPKMLVDVSQNTPVDLAERLYFWLTNQEAVEAAHAWQLDEIKKYDVNNVGPRIVKLYNRAIARRRASGHN